MIINYIEHTKLREIWCMTLSQITCNPAIAPVTYTIEAAMLMNMLVPCMIFIVSNGFIYILNADMLSDC